MFELWVPVTIAAGFFQNLRSAVQKKLTDDLSTVGASYARFIFALPVVCVYLYALVEFGDWPLPQPDEKFMLFVFGGAITQILFTVSLLWTFSFKSFAVGTTFSKLEVIMVAVVAVVVLGETLNGWAVFSIAVSSLGVLALSMNENKLSIASLFTGLLSKATMIGLLTAGLLGASSALYRGATQALGYEPFYVNAAYTLLLALIIQTLIMGAWILMRDPTMMNQVFKQWRWTGLAGVAGAFASICWFTAFTIQKAAYVRALGQIELVFTFLVTLVYFREKVTVHDYFGVLLITVGIVVLLILG